MKFKIFLTFSLIASSAYTTSVPTLLGAPYENYLKTLSHGEKPQPVSLRKICLTRDGANDPQDGVVRQSQQRLLVLSDATHQIIAILDYDRDTHTFAEFQEEFEAYFDLSKMDEKSRAEFKISNR